MIRWQELEGLIERLRPLVTAKADEERATERDGDRGEPDGLAADRLMTASEVAALLRISQSTLYANARAGAYPFTRRGPGATVRFSRRGVLAWIAGQAPGSTSASA